MKTEEELLADFINEYHSDEAMDIATDPLLYIYWRDSTEFAAYRLHYHCNIMFLSVCKLFRIDKICKVISRWLK